MIEMDGLSEMENKTCERAQGKEIGASPHIDPFEQFSEAEMDLSKLFVEMDPQVMSLVRDCDHLDWEQRKSNGAIYTPSALANYVASKVISLTLNDKRSSLHNQAGPTSWRILDPACGGGELLVAVWQQLLSKIAEEHSFYFNHLMPRDILCGIDNDKKAVSKTRTRINSFCASETQYLKIINTNALFPFNRRTSYQGWKQIRKQFEAPEGFDIVIANPPWGAETRAYEKKLVSTGEFTTFSGQFDTSDLFLELSSSVLKPGGYLAYIVPDSLFSLERTALRKLLLSQTDILFVGRFGERFFKDVNRACAVIIARKREPNIASRVSARTQCLRLTPDVRKDLLLGRLSFHQAERSLVHSVRQDRFLHNENFSFDIDLTERDEITINKLTSAKNNFRSYLNSYRGVELSKTGKVIFCNECKLWLPLPRAKNPKCAHCGAKLRNDEQDIIVRDKKLKGYQTLLSGEDIRRYHIEQRLWIDVRRNGINYKSLSQYESPKILVRKTGVGLSASMDYTDSLTNQVVYIFRAKDGVEIPLEFFLGVINSRAMYYYHVKKHGETEWRSHPYVTQKQVLDFPLPNDATLSVEKKHTVEEIAKLVGNNLKKNKPFPVKADVQIERFVAELFDLRRKDYEIIYQTLESVQDLLPVRALKNVAINQIFEVD